MKQVFLANSLCEGDIVVALKDIQGIQHTMPQGEVGIIRQCAFTWCGIVFGSPQDGQFVTVSNDVFDESFTTALEASGNPPLVDWENNWQGYQAWFSQK